MLFSIVYFYSSLARFALVAGLGLAVYLYRIGFFGQRNAGQGNMDLNNLNQNNNVDPNQLNNRNANQNDLRRENGEANGNPENNEPQPDIDAVGSANENTNGATGTNLPNVQIEPSFL